VARLRAFLAVAEHRSFTGAARSLAVSPSAVSQAVARLEDELGVALLVRTTRRKHSSDLKRPAQVAAVTLTNRTSVCSRMDGSR
jgi:molybdenum-dependent DNA-binding transcriptional regulator ModE